MEAHLHVERGGVDEQPAPLDEAGSVRRDVLVARQRDSSNDNVEAQARLRGVHLHFVLREACDIRNTLRVWSSATNLRDQPCFALNTAVNR